MIFTICNSLQLSFFNPDLRPFFADLLSDALYHILHFLPAFIVLNIFLMHQPPMSVKKELNSLIDAGTGVILTNTDKWEAKTDEICEMFVEKVR